VLRENSELLAMLLSEDNALCVGTVNDALYRAIGQLNAAFVQRLLRCGRANPNHDDGLPLGSAIESDSIEVRQHLFWFPHRLTFLQIFKMLLEHGADINKQTMEGTPLFYAVSRGKLEFVKLCLESGQCDVNLKHDGESPLMRAATNQHIDICKVLLNHPRMIGR